jgi:predicted oxidoreductase
MAEADDPLISRLISGEVTIDSVPVDRRTSLLDRLQVAKNEFLVARSFDRARHYFAFPMAQPHPARARGARRGFHRSRRMRYRR